METATNELDTLIEKLRAERNEAIEKMRSFVYDHSPEHVPPEIKRPVIERRVMGAFILAEDIVRRDPDTVHLTAEDCRRLADEAEEAGVEPDVNREPYQKAYEFIFDNLRDYCVDTDGLEDMLELCFREYMATRVWGHETPKESQPLSPVKEEKETGYSPMVHGKATDAMGSMVGRPLTPNAINDTASIEMGGTKIVMSQYSQLGSTGWGVSTHKVFLKALTEFTKLNHTGRKEREVRELGVSFNLKEYAHLCGYDVYEHPTKTEEEKKAEKKRAKIELDNARKRMDKDTEILFNSRISWTENVRGKEQDFLDIHPIGAKGRKNGMVYMSFTPEMGEYLIQLPLTQIPDALYRVDGNHVSAWGIGLALWEHYNMDSNQKRGTAQLLKVETLLKETKLPSYESFERRESWTGKIKEPFEDIMEYLVQTGVLEDWRYSHSKGVELTDEEADFTDYEVWADTLIFYTLKNAPDHTARLEAKDEERKKKNAYKKKKQ